MIEYRFRMRSGEVHEFFVDVDRATPTVEPSPPPKAWTRLGFQQCANCPLDASQHPYCPAALDIEHIAHRFSDIPSFESVRVEVITPVRTYVKDCDAQMGLRALLGLVMASSACPIVSQLKGLTHFHLPFANLEETLFRVASAYLLKQYFIRKSGGHPDFALQGLSRLYQDLQTVNACFKARLDAASSMDANLNAVCSLNFLSALVSWSLDDALHGLERYFGEGLG